jgi:CDP-4-dehydro-6-deoxyglucose reductase
MNARLIESTEIAPEVRHFVFEACDVDRLDFTPGQFVSLTGQVGEKKITRPYSVASVPNGTNRFELCLNRLKEGIFSPRLFELKPGDTLEMRKPMGMFVVRNPATDCLLIATGTGIAPMRSLLHAHLKEGSQAFTLLFGVRYEQSLMYRQEWEEFAKRYPHFRFIPVVSRPEPSWTGRTGHVQAHLEEAVGERRDLDVFLCGMKAMVDDVRSILKEKGFDKKQLLFEKYD